MSIRVFLAACLLPLTGISCSGADDEKKEAPAENEQPTLLEVGAEAPPFTLPNQADEPADFSELIKKRKATAFVFYRSADW